MTFPIIASISIVAMFVCQNANGQGAQVSGLITDSSGASQPDTWITLTKEETGTRYFTRSSRQGYYFIPATQPGLYRIRVRKEGFQTAVQMGVRLASGQNARIDFVLQIGIHEESVEVRDQARPLDTEDFAAGTVIGRGMIDRLPLNGHGLLTLLEIVPGVTVTPAGAGESGQFSAAGQRADSNYVTLDGISLDNGIGVIGTDTGRGVQLGGVVPVYTALGTTQSLVSADAIEEFRVQTSGLTADQGRTLGAHVSLTTRAGSNQLHGSLNVDGRNEALDANDWFAARGGQARSRFRMRDISGTLGGPIRQNRTFFFVSHESLRLDHPSTSTQLVPDALSRLSAPPAVRWLVDALPMPNGPDGTLTVSAPRSSSADSTGIRLDHSFGARHQFFSRFNRAPSSDALANPGSLLATRVSVSSESLTAGIDSAFGPSGSHSLRVNWTGVREGSDTSTRALGRAVDLGQYLAPLAERAGTAYSLQILTPGISLVADGAAGSQRQWNVVDSATVTRGRHSLAFGADYRSLAPGLTSPPYLVTAVYADLYAFAAGNPLAAAASRRNSVSLELDNLSAFARDEWRISPRMLLNYGVRWEYNPAPGGGEGAPLFQSVTPGNPPQVHIGQQGGSLWRTGWRNFAPRVGVVTRLDGSGRTVLRGSAGLFYDPGFATALQASISQISTNVSLANTVNGITAIYSDSSTASAASASDLVANFRLPYSFQWNTTLSRQVANGSVASLAWIGSAGRRLLRLEQSKTAGGDSLAFYTNRGESRYQAMQAQLHAHPRQDLDVLASFTWAHSIDNASRSGDLFLSQPDWPGDIDRGNSSFDVRRSFSAAFTASPRMWRGWSLHGVFRARTGFPLTVMALNPQLTFGLESRPDLIAGQPVWIVDGSTPGGRRLNADAFQAPSQPRPGSLGRNAIQGFGMHQSDVALQREFRFGERLKTQLRLEAFNVFNHPNFGNPNTFLSDPAFGRPVSMLNQFLGTGGPSTGLVPAFQIGGPRSMQVALRLRF